MHRSNIGRQIVLQAGSNSILRRHATLSARRVALRLRRKLFCRTEEGSSLFSRRLEIAGARKRVARGCLPLARPFFLSSKYFQAPGTQPKKGHKPETFVRVCFFKHLISNITSSAPRRKLSKFRGTTILYFSEIILGITRLWQSTRISCCCSSFFLRA